jgi:hypothetical protein
VSDSDANDLITPVRHQSVVQTKKQIVGHEEGSDPGLEPLFANHFELFQVGTDIYLDIGIVRPEDIARLKQKVESAPGDVHTVTFNVLQRIAMSPDSFERLSTGVDTIKQGIGGEKVASSD